MRWPWSKPKLPEIPPFRPAPPVQVRPKRVEPTILVEEEDTSAMTRTGVHEEWKRRAGLPE